MTHHYGCDCAGPQRQLSEAQGRMDGWAIAMRQANRITVSLRHDLEEAQVRASLTAIEAESTLSGAVAGERLAQARAEAAEALAAERGLVLMQISGCLVCRACADMARETRAPAEAQEEGDDA